MIASQADGEVTRQKRPTDADVPGRGEKKLTLSILEHTDGNRTLPLEVLGISREGLRTKVACSAIRSDGRA